MRVKRGSCSENRYLHDKKTPALKPIVIKFLRSEESSETVRSKKELIAKNLSLPN